MSAGAGAGPVAVAAAAAALEALRQEEEEMTAYSPEDLNDGWEFKIIRSSVAAFRDPQKLRAVLDEEAQAGWQFLEKFDDTRLRLKRPISARQLDGKLDFDAYRSYFGPSEAALAVVVLTGVLGAIVGLVILAVGLATKSVGLVLLGLVLLLGVPALSVYWHRSRSQPRKPAGPGDLL
jgi:hypothetical protein